jgi:secreted PhoX family phosphatase
MLFRWADEFWMVPESSENGTIELYRAARFPNEWELEKVLVGQVRASDSVLFFHQGRVWLMTSMESSRRGVWDSLHLYCSDSPLGEWKPHRLNPVVRDASRARPAGAIFTADGRLIRPGQDCSRRYGSAIQFCRIDALNEQEYRETPIARLAGEQLGASGTHTYSRDDALEAVDGLRAEIDPRGKLLSVVGTARRLFGRI